MVQITLTEALAMAEPGDVLRVDFDGLDPSFMVRTLKGWYDATASQRVDKSETWEGYDCTQLTKPNGVVYSIRGQADAPILETPSTSPNCGGASGQPAADSQDAPSVADVSLRREVWQLAEQLRTLQARVDYLEGEDGLHTVADSKALAAIRTLQQDVAALKQQGGDNPRCAFPAGSCNPPDCTCAEMAGYDKRRAQEQQGGDLREGEPIEAQPTARGFMAGEFLDHYGARCSIQESSVCGPAQIWLGIDSYEGSAYHNNPPAPFSRMLLTRKHVKQLLPLLRHFVKHGTLPQPPASGVK